mmetsp:Transcript_34817/g.81294  ORF Transcript_34817/g.81294 Transcript_34817/m.81294 type:complete len:498 (-) Transcript_34817:188-1681(-)|eukprot:CAMPEP_0178401972 /NCGR_PEP_ID=MMETSP0689_2-20121128/16594_1 /TAXON_ID=160604 /ORGANISM="Amphidinium massartii, Strain CS-259" /LENGTH=497 /DNA_ID=CAMNT_0020022843 /DNA_START=57 /DNA_END=1550 /DNA_ORIENTATION=-
MAPPSSEHSAACPKSFRVAIFNEPIVGTINPTLPIVASLTARGCDVRYYCADVSMKTFIEEAGATFEHFNCYLGKWQEVLAEEADWLKSQGFEAGDLATTPPFGQLIHLNMAFYSLPAGLCLAHRVVDRWQAAGAWSPHLVIHSCQAAYAYLAASKIGVPVASFMTWPGPGVPMQLACLASEAEREAWDANLVKHPAIISANAVGIREFGVDIAGTQLGCRHFNTQLNIIFSVPALGAPVPPRQQALMAEKSFRWVGYTGNQELHVNGAQLSSDPQEHSPGSSEDAPWLVPAGVKVLLVTLGSRTVGVLWNGAFHISSSGRYTGKEFSHRLWQELIDHFAERSDVRVILGVGPVPDALAGLTLPSNFAARQCLPQIEALRHSDAFITHGGANSIMEGHLAGTPMIVLPFCVDQHSNGEAVERAGAGRVFQQLMEEAPGSIALAAEEALFGESAAQQRASSEEVGRQLRAAGGADAAADACLGLLAAPSPSSRAVGGA